MRRGGLFFSRETLALTRIQLNPVNDIPAAQQNLLVLIVDNRLALISNQDSVLVLEDVEAS